jgi:MFS family permease
VTGTPPDEPSAGTRDARPPARAPEPGRSATPRPTLPPTVRRLGWLHAANDFTLDFLTPLLPAGVPAAWIGVMEGAADATAQVLRLATGRRSDATGRRAAWVRAGYGTNAIARPLASLGIAFAWPLWVVGCRVADRVGKGLRGSATDALVADWVDAPARARAYAHMRTMDHLGATAGAGAAALAAWSLALEPDDARELAWLVAALVLPMVPMLWWCRGLRDHPDARPRGVVAPPGWWPRSPRLRVPLLAIAVAALGAKLAPLLVLVKVARLPLDGRAAGGAWPLWLTCLAWGAIAIVQAGAATFAGVMTERLGARRFLVGTWLLTAVAFAAMAIASGPWLVAAALGWAALAGLGDGAEKTWLAELAPREERALAFGALGVVLAIAMLAGSAAVGFALPAYGGLAFLLPAAGLVGGSALLVARRGPAVPCAARSP